MDVKQKRFYRREWKLNQPHLPKSTSLPLLRLIPSNRVVFLCEQCGFSNLLVPICLWCCWSSVEAQRDFEASARKTLRRVARSAPRLFGKPGSPSLIRRQDVTFAGKHQARKGLSKISTGSTSSHILGSRVVNAETTIVGSSSYQNTQTSYSRALCFFRGIREGEQVVRKPAKTNSAIKSKSGKVGGPCRPGSSENSLEPFTDTFEHPRPKADLISDDHTQEGHEGWAKGVACDFALCSSPPSSSQVGFGLLQPYPQLGDRSTFLTPCLPASVHAEASPSSSAPNLIGSIKIDAPMVDTRPVTFTVSTAEQSLLPSTPCDTVEARNEQYTGQRTADRRSWGAQEAEPMDVDVATATQPAPIPAMIHAEVFSDEQPQDFDMVPIMNTTLTKTGRKRAPIPSILLDQNVYPTASIFDNQASYIPITTTKMTTEVSATTPTHLATPPRTLRRQKKRLSLSNLSTNTRANTPSPSNPPICFSPPPVQTSSSPQFTPTLSAIVTSPHPPSQDLSHPVLSPAIVISAPVATTTTPSTPITPLTLSQSLPRIGTPKRPYYSTIRANMNGRTGSSSSQLSTPPASPSSYSSGGTFGSPESISHTHHHSAGMAQNSVSIIVDGTSMAVDGVGTHRPTPTSPIVTVPPLPPVVDIPIPIPVPVPRHMRPSSPVRNIPSVLDPVSDGDDKDEEEIPYREFGMGSTSRFGRILRERRSGNLKGKDKSRGDNGGSGGYHFALSFSRSLGRKRGGTCSGLAPESQEREPNLPLPTLSMSRGYPGVGGVGPGRGYSMSGEMEMRMALAERNVNAGSENGNGLDAAFKFRENQRPSCDGDGRMNRGKGKKLIKMRSTIGLTSSPFMASPSSPSSKPRIGSRLKEMSFSFLGRFQGGEANRS